MPLKVLIVDDEPVARRRIKRFLRSDPDAHLVGECGDGAAALQAVRTLDPDVVFLDVKMPGIDGLKALRSLAASSRRPAIVLVTAYDQYAIAAFEHQALDYLLKPFDQPRFTQALKRAKAHCALYNGASTGAERPVPSDFSGRTAVKPLVRLLVRSRGRMVFVRCAEIDWIEAAGKHVRLHVGQMEYLLREPLHRLESHLDPERFIRIHRSTIVNVDRIREIESGFHGDLRVSLEDGTELTLSRNYRDRIQMSLEQAP
jgi:two-component system, LytTR family, response regulator